jgi:Flp pilus assembly protein TadG
MRRLSDDRGAVAVFVALIMVPLLVCTALVIDMGAGYVRKRQLQNAADAAVLAVAQNCASSTGCGDITSTATTFTTANVPGSAASATPVVSGNIATVTTSSVVSYSFAPVIGVDQQNVTATATAKWGSPTGGTAVLPIAFSWCAFAAQTGGGVPTGTTPTTMLLPKTDASVCSGPTGNPMPGGFAWLGSSDCSSTTDISTAQVPGDPGRSPAGTGCSAAYMATLQGKTLILPVYDTFGGSGSSAWYHIYAYVAFTLTGYNFGGLYKWPQPPPCSGNDSCLAGYFTKMVAPSDVFTYGAGTPDLGARIVYLTK